MELFHISRINTPKGIFRISGSISVSAPQAIKLSSLEIMGTDGWVQLQLKVVDDLIESLTPFVEQHLNTQHNK